MGKRERPDVQAYGLMVGLEVDVFVWGILAFPNHLVILWQGLFEDSDHSPAFIQWEVIHSDIDGLAIAMLGPLVMSIERVMGRGDGRGEVFTELALEHLDYVDQAAFELRGKLHYDT